VSTEFLDDDDLHRLTGYVRPAKQIEWLLRHNIPYLVNAKGKLVVRRNLETPYTPFQLGPVR
jgi:hypothetical protein